MPVEFDVSLYNTVEGTIIFRDIVASSDGCEPALVWLNAAIAEGVTLREVFVRVRTDNPDTYQNWARWCRTSLAAQMPDPLKIKFTEVACLDDPVTAAEFDLNLADLTADEKQFVRRAWMAKYQPDGQSILPKIEEELRSGVVTRACGDPYED